MSCPALHPSLRRPAEPSGGRKAMLLRVGIDRGTGGALAPIFPDGTFEYIPIPEAVATRSPLTYATLPGRHAFSLAAVLPPRLAGKHPHLDPDFETATYGDAAPRKRRQLLRLAPGDLLLFYAGLAPRPPEDRPRLFAIGSLHVRHVHHLRSCDIGRRDLRQRFAQTAHFLRRTRDEDLALVEGNPGADALFERAIPLGDPRDCLLRDLAGLGYEGSLLRSVGHWVKEPDGLQLLERWLDKGPACLVGNASRLVPIAPSLLDLPHEPGDLGIEDREAREGDWIVALARGGNRRIRALARVNRVVSHENEGRALSSLFWLFPGEGLTLGEAVLPPLSRNRPVTNAAEIRRLVSWFSQRWRIGVHRLPGREPGTGILSHH